MIEGPPELVEQRFVNIVENEDGSRGLLRHTEFLNRISPDPSPDRAAAEWVIQRGGSVDLHVKGKTRRFVSSVDQLPEGPFVAAEFRMSGLGSMSDLQLREFAGICAGVKLPFGLHLQHTAVTDAGLQSVKDLPIAHLILDGTQVSDTGLTHLQELSALHALDLGGTRVTDLGVEKLAAMSGLDSLALSSTEISDRALEYLSALPNLRTLTIQSVKITNDGLRHLAGHRNLRTLLLNANQIGDEGVKHLAGLMDLGRLELQGTAVSDQSVAVLKQLTNLGELNLIDTAVTESGAAALHKALPGCRISYGNGKSPIVLEPSTGNDRKAAEWVLEQGGRVSIAYPDGTHGSLISDRSELPSEPFQLFEIQLSGLKSIPDEMPLRQLSRLIQVSFAGSRTTSKQIRQLADLPRLQVLGAGNAELDDDCIQHLNQFPLLTHLDVTVYSEDAIRRLAGLTQIRELGIDIAADLKGEPLDVMATMPNLEDVRISNGDLRWSEVAKLARIPKLRRLALDSRRSLAADPEGFQELSAFSNLKTLLLADMSFSDPALSQLPLLPEVEELAVLRCNLSDEGVRKLAEFPRLKALYLANTPTITDAAFAHLKALDALEELNVVSCNVTAEAVLSLSKALPKCRITYGPEANPVVIEPVAE